MANPDPEEFRRLKRYMSFVIRDIPPEAEVHEVKKAIAKAYHATVMENDRWLLKRLADNSEGGHSLPNFEIELRKDHRSTGRLQSRGKMLLPIWGVAFKDYVLAHPVQVPFHPNFFDKSHVQWGEIKIVQDVDARPQAREKISNLKSNPWQDPDLEHQHEVRCHNLRGVCDVREIQFGFDHFRPQTNTRQLPGQPKIVHRFYVEWARKFEATDVRAYLEFEDGINSITIVIGPDNTLIRQFLKVRYETIKRLQRKNSTITFNLWSAPILEEGPIDHDESRPRSRLSGLDDAHRRVISRFPTKFHVTFYGEDIMKDFILKADVVGLTVESAHENLDTDDGLGVMGAVSKKNKRRMGDYLDELSDTKMHELTRKWLATVPYPVAFQLAALLQNGLVNPIEMRDLRILIHNLIHPTSTRSIEDVGRLLFRFSQSIPTWTVADRLKHTLNEMFTAFEEAFWKEGDNLTNTVKAGWFWSYRATLTPTTLRLSGPFQEQSNGVIRQYHYAAECFLRLDFTDEERLQMRWDRDVQGDVFVKERVGGTLKSSLNIAGRQFDFLGYSNSGLREHSVWFVTPFRNKENDLVTADTIRDGIANFSLRLEPLNEALSTTNGVKQIEFSGDAAAIARIKASEIKLRTLPSKLGARLAQAYTTTDPSIELSRDEIEIISDITVENPTESTVASEFTDGYGCISLQLADEIWKALNADSAYLPNPAPSCYQIRLGGAKGVVGINPLLTGRKIVLHESMIKFLSSDTGLHIANKFDHPLALYLNRPLIAILEHLGVATDWFLRLQTKALTEQRETLLSISDDAADFLNTRHLGRPYGFGQIMRGLTKYGIKRAVLEDAPHPMLDFFLRSLSVATVHVHRELKYRARILVSNPKAWSLVGVADVHQELDEWCVYICTQESEKELKYYPENPSHVDSEGNKYGYVYITRSPSIHPGDVQRFKAMHPPETSLYSKHPMVNCVVFSCKGDRPPASMLGGGDLDGDLFQIMPETEDFKPDTCDPAAYSPVEPHNLERPVNIDDIADFVVDYINSDKMGLVSIQHLIISDQSRRGLHDPKCLKLAELHSKAVDFAKSGKPVHFKDLPKRIHPYTPDFQHKETTLDDQTNYYESPKALGVLYRSIQVRPPEPISSNPNQRAVPYKEHPFYMKLVDICQDKRVTRGLVTEERKSDIKKAFRSYSRELRGIRRLYSIGRSPLSEEEVFVGTILDEASNRRSRDDMIARLREVSARLVDRVRIFFQGYRDDGANKEESLHLWLVRSMYGLQCALGEEVARTQGRIVKDWKEAQCSFGMIALRSAFECLDVMDKRRPDPRKPKP